MGDAGAVNIRISVRNLVEFLLRSGDIDRRGGRVDTDAMAEGSRAHRKIQKEGGPGYHAEVPLSHTLNFSQDGYLLTIEGRADGVLYTEDGIVIDEIKGVRRDVTKMEGPVPVHAAQAMCYAWMELSDLREEYEGKSQPVLEGIDLGPKALTRITVQMTYTDLETGTIRRMTSSYFWEELDSWFQDLTGQYRRWAKFTVDHRARRQDTVRKVEFPYPYREGQRTLVASVYRTIEQKKQLFIQAPTGSGKTMATVFPAVRAIGEGMGERIFYLTAKTIARTAAEDAFALLRSAGMDFLTVTITAKEKVCPLMTGDSPENENTAGPPCNPMECPRARGHFDRVNDAVYEMLTAGTSFRRPDILRQAERWNVCPFEMTLDLTEWVDAIICDYNYVFDPSAKLQRFFGTGTRGGDAIFLIDEAHNLVERGRSMYSADLTQEEFRSLGRVLKKRHTGAALVRALNACSRSLSAMWRQAGGEGRPAEDDGAKAAGDGFDGKAAENAAGAGFAAGADIACHPESADGGTAEDDAKAGFAARQIRPGVFEVPGAGVLSLRLQILTQAIEEYLDKPQSEDLSDEIMALYFRVSEFQGACERMTERYLSTLRRTDADGVGLRISCMDPSADLQECMDRGRAAILFSGTLVPVSYYRSLLSGRKDDYAIYAPSSFDPRNRRILIARDVSTRYKTRTPGMYRRIAAYIRIVARAQSGNYMAFFPSYRMMDEIADLCEEEEDPDTRIVRQKSRMSEREKEEFLGLFRMRSAAGDGGAAGGPAGDGAAEDGAAGNPAGDGGAAGGPAGDSGAAGSPAGDGAAGYGVRTGKCGTLIGFCVMGSAFSEGIDLRNDSLIGVIVAGTGFPQVGEEREILRSWFDRRGMDGFLYSYMCPGLNKVLQAAGRVIRTEQDRGVIVLLDERFAQASYRRFLPGEWKDAEYVTLDNAASRLEQFWKLRYTVTKV